MFKRVLAVIEPSGKSSGVALLKFTWAAMFIIGAMGSSLAFAQTGSWSTKTSMPTPRWGLGAGVVNGVMYAVGGFNDVTLLQTNEAYDPATNSWSTKMPMPDACNYVSPCGRYDFGVAVVNGILYAIAGGCPGAYCVPAVNQAYNPVTNSWSSKAPALTPRAGLAAAAVNGIIYTFGGYNGGVLGTVEAYDPSTDTWTTKTSMPTPRVYAAASVVNGIIYVIGGSSSSGVVTTVEAYNPSTDTWTTKASMPTARAFLAAGVVNGIVYNIGGYDNTGTLGTNEAYYPATNSWSTNTSMPTARYALAAGVLNGIVYAVGGRNNAAVLSTNEAFNPASIPTKAADCKDGGWMTLTRADGSSFKNQGDCIQYVNTGK